MKNEMKLKRLSEISFCASHIIINYYINNKGRISFYHFHDTIIHLYHH